VPSRFRPDQAAALRLVPRPSEPASSSPAPKARVSDDDLLAAVRAGDPEVATALCDRVWPQVERTARRLLGKSDPDRDDVEQLSLIELVNTIGRYRGDCSLDTWAQTVTSHVAFKHIRRRRIERTIFTDLLVDDSLLPASSAAGERRSLSRDLLMRVAALLDGMNHQRAWAFILHDVLGYDLREIAEMTKTSVAATQSRLVRGRRELHAKVAADPALAEAIQRIEEPR
jgi:RNA polymerase sigma-70 factor (ECF subfamily)